MAAGTNNGKVGIGTTAPDSKLSVNGSIRAKEVKVESTNWPDYVFLPDYSLMPLDDLEMFINKNGHLPNIPTEADVQQNGLKLAEINAKLLQKIEELTLYIIQQQELIIEHEEVNKQQYDLIERLSDKMGQLERTVGELSNN